MNAINAQPLRRATSSNHPDIIVLGGSHGSLDPLLKILAALPAELAAAVFVVQHRAPGALVPIALFETNTAMKVERAVDHAPILAGSVYFAPPGLHLLLDEEGIRVLHGPRENLARPSIDVLFRSAAVAFGSRVIGVILSGALDDGELGLVAVRRCGGYTIVQDPEDSADASLPRAALNAHPDATSSVAGIAPMLLQLVGGSLRAPPKVPEDLALEARVAAVAMSDPADLSRIGQPSHFTCPECQGPLWLMPSVPEEYRCDIGHSFTLQTLARAQALALERALWVAFRVINERARLLERLAHSSEERGMTGVASGYLERQRELRGHAQSLLDALACLEAPLEAESPPVT